MSDEKRMRARERARRAALLGSTVKHSLSVSVRLTPEEQRLAYAALAEMEGGDGKR